MAKGSKMSLLYSRAFISGRERQKLNSAFKLKIIGEEEAVCDCIIL